MLENLEAVEKRYEELNRLMSDPDIITRQSEFKKYALEHSELSPIVREFRDLKRINHEIEENEHILKEENDSEHFSNSR